MTLQSIFVTVGSTLFPALTNLILSPDFLDHLVSLDVARLVVQYGRADIRIPGSSSVDVADSGRFTWKRLDVEVKRFTDDFDGLVKRSDGVISHAGALPHHSC